ncbi:MAG TPA: adenylosuccinate lyase, partial [Geminicoccaceae bacterium]|nr:adenylosuccinate lyase [Geminicoccaceae bacterium]
NVALWHERDISHSSVERVIAPDTTILLDFALHRLTSLVEKMVVYPERMRENLESLRGLVSSQGVLLALVDAGLPRRRAYELVQRHALATWDGGRSLRERLAADEEVTARLAPEALDALFDLGVHTRHVDTVFARVFGSGG